MDSVDTEARPPRRRTPLVAATRVGQPRPTAGASGSPSVAPTPQPAAPPEARPVQPAAAVPRTVWLVTAVHVVLLVAYSLLVPTFRAPEEAGQVERVLHLAGVPPVAEGPPVDPALGPATPERARAALTEAVQAGVASSPAYVPGAPPVDIADAVPPDDRPTFGELAVVSPVTPGDGSSADPGVDREADPRPRRPPLTAWLGAAVLTLADLVLPGWPWSFDRTVALLRLVDVAVVAAVPLLAWATARRFGCPPRASLTAAVAVLAVPQLTHIGSVVGDDALVVTLAGVVFLLGARVLTGDSSPRTAVLAGVACGLALLASGSAVVLVAWMVGAYLLAPGRTPGGATGPPQRRLRRGLPLIVVALATVVGGWWHLGHAVADRSLSLGLERVPTLGPGAGSGLASRLLADIWGAFGWREAVLPTGAVVALTVALVGALVVAFARGRVRTVRLRLAFLVLPATLLGVLAVLAAGWSTLFADNPLRVEGRVVLVGVVGLAVVGAVGLDQLRSRPSRLLPAVVFVVAVGVQLLAMAAITARYWAGASGGERLRAVLAFSPWPPAAVFFAAVGAVAVVAWTFIALVRQGRPAPGVAIPPA